VTVPFKRVSLAALGLAATALPALATPALASPSVATDSAVYVERVTLRGGEPVRRLEPAARLVHGDRVVTVVSWYRMGGDGGFTVVNALPAGLAYQASGQNGEEVSTDGGRNWGRLGALTIGGRLASPEDVTHVRWRVSAAQALAGTGRITYAGFVR
jgi:hypothetical protein